jgi:hypothetical protein
MPGQPDDDSHTIDQYHDHMATIRDAINRWREGRLSTYGKRKAIADENQRYYHGPRKSPLTGESISSMPRSDDVAAMLADATGVQLEAATSAMRTRQQAYVMARQLLDDGGTTEAAVSLVTEGVRASLDILGSARAPSQLRAITGGQP